MNDDIDDATSRTKGSLLYEGTTRFYAEGDQYASQTWRFRANDQVNAVETLDRLSDDSMYADPRIDYVREFEVEEQADVLDEDGEPVGA